MKYKKSIVLGASGAILPFLIAGLVILYQHYANAEFWSNIAAHSEDDASHTAGAMMALSEVIELLFFVGASLIVGIVLITTAILLFFRDQRSS